MPAWLHDSRLDRRAWYVQVSLMRQMEKSTRDFGDWRKEREKEVMQLRRQVSLASKFHLVYHCSTFTKPAAFGAAVCLLGNVIPHLKTTTWSCQHCA